MPRCRANKVSLPDMLEESWLEDGREEGVYLTLVINLDGTYPESSFLPFL